MSPQPPSGLRQSDSGWHEPLEPWTGQSFTEEGIVFVGAPDGQEQAHRGRVVRDDGWVHVQTESERLSFPAVRVNAIQWASR